jgi:hypothetical protein
MLARTIALTAALMMASTPSFAADLGFSGDGGARRSAAVMGAYFKVPLGAPRSADLPARAGLRLAMTHDYRTSSAPGARRIEADGLDLRLTGKQPTLYLAGRAITGEQAKLEAGAGGGGRLDKVMIGAAVALAAVAGFVIVSSVD